MIRRVGLIANPDKISCRDAVREAARIIVSCGRTGLTEPPTARMAGLDLPQCPDVASLARETDLLVVFGGDGTMLRVSREIAGMSTPILGINVGGLGFLTAVPSSQLGSAMDSVWQERFTLEERALLAASGQASGKPIHQIALNDFVLGRGLESRMIELEVTVDGEVLTRYRCDGLVVSSPTGSTAYSLSAGGAVVCPNAEVMALTPICPHTLSNRSVLVSLSSIVQVKVISQRLETILTADGQVQTALATGDVITVSRCEHGVRLLRLAGSSFFETLRKKLNWSGTNVRAACPVSDHASLA